MPCRTVNITSHLPAGVVAQGSSPKLTGERAEADAGLLRILEGGADKVVRIFVIFFSLLLKSYKDYSIGHIFLRSLTWT